MSVSLCQHETIIVCYTLCVVMSRNFAVIAMCNDAQIHSDCAVDIVRDDQTVAELGKTSAHDTNTDSFTETTHTVSNNNIICC